MKIPSLFKPSQNADSKTDRQRAGDRAEAAALKQLEQAGLTLVARNYHCRFGEIDLILREQDTLVFVEVRFRKSSRYGTPLETVTARKQDKIRRAAQLFIMENKVSAKHPLRFDVVGITGNSTEWIKGAFY